MADPKEDDLIQQFGVLIQRFQIGVVQGQAFADQLNEIAQKLKVAGPSGKKLADALDDLTKNFNPATTSADKLEKKLEELVESLEDTAPAFAEVKHQLSGSSKDYAIYRKAVEDVIVAHRNLKSPLAATVDAYKAQQRAIQENMKKAIGAQSRINAEIALRQQIDAAIKSNAKSYMTLGEAINKAKTFVGKWTTVLGGTAFGITNARDALFKYNQSMFNFSRTQQVTGGSMGNMSKAFKTVGESTTFSRRQFASFLDTASSGWKGVAPTSEAFANLASHLQSAFGPNVEKAESAMKSLLDVQNKFPAMANTIMSAMEKIKADPKKYEGLRKSLLAQIAVQQASGKITKQQGTEFAQMLTKTTKEQDKQVRSNKAAATMAQKSEDLLLGMAQSAEPAMARLTESINKLVGLLGQMPGAILASSAALALMNKQIMIPSFSNLFKGGISTPSISMGGMGGMGGMGAIGGLFGRLFKGKAAAATPASVMSTTLAKSAGTAETASSIGRWGRAIGRMSGGLRGGAGMGLIQGGLSGYMDYTNERDLRKAEGYDDEVANKAGMRKGIGSAGGAIAGSIIGGIVGSFAGPAGTMIGATIGGALGAKWGGDAGKKWADSFVAKSKKAGEELNKELDKEASNMMQIANLYQEKLANLQTIVESNQKVVALQREQISLLQEMGILSSREAPGMFGETLNQIKQMKSNLEGFFQGMFDEGGMAGLFGSMGVTLSDSIKKSISGGDYVGAAKQISIDVGKELSKISEQKIKLETKMREAPKGEQGDKQKAEAQDEINALVVKEDSLRSHLNQVMTQSKDILTANRDIVQGISNSYNYMEEQVMRMNPIAEQRLQTERELMEAAQFGMGASIEMMQKQADMAFQLMQVEKERIDMADAAVSTQLEQITGSKDQADQIRNMVKNARSFMEVQKIISNLGIKDKATQGVLTKYYTDQQDATNKIMQQQKKVYDLTKEMREGYLDAIREMTVGAGEFEKIIGTQEMGVTQLMDAINQANPQERNMGNTMKLGGYQDAAATASGLGTQITGKYSASGPMLSFMPGQGGADTTELRNSRIRGYDKSVQAAYGMLNGTAEPPQAGTALADEKYLNTFRDAGNGLQNAGSGLQVAAQDLKDAAVIIAREGGYISKGKKTSDIMDGAESGIKFLNRAKYNANEKQKTEDVVKIPVTLLKNAQVQTKADPSRLVNLKGFRVENQGQRYIYNERFPADRNNAEQVNDWKSGIGQVDYIRTKDGRKIKPHSRDVVTATRRTGGHGNGKFAFTSTLKSEKPSDRGFKLMPGAGIYRDKAPIKYTYLPTSSASSAAAAPAAAAPTTSDTYAPDFAAEDFEKKVGIIGRKKDLQKSYQEAGIKGYQLTLEKIKAEQAQGGLQYRNVKSEQDMLQEYDDIKNLSTMYNEKEEAKLKAQADAVEKKMASQQNYSKEYSKSAWGAAGGSYTGNVFNGPIKDLQEEANYYAGKLQTQVKAKKAKERKAEIEKQLLSVRGFKDIDAARQYVTETEAKNRDIESWKTLDINDYDKKYAEAKASAGSQRSIVEYNNAARNAQVNSPLSNEQIKEIENTNAGNGPNGAKIPATPIQQAKFLAKRAEAQTTYNLTPGGAQGGGAVSGTIVIELSADLSAKIASMEGVFLQIEQSSSRSG